MLAAIQAEKSPGTANILVGGRALCGIPFRWRDLGAHGTADTAAARALTGQLLGVGEDSSTVEAG